MHLAFSKVTGCIEPEVQLFDWPGQAQELGLWASDRLKSMPDASAQRPWCQAWCQALKSFELTCTVTMTLFGLSLINWT